MNAINPINTIGRPAALTGALSREAKMRMTRPLFLGSWSDVVFVHFEIDPAVFQPLIPFPLELRDGQAWVSLVAFTLRRMRIGFAEKATEWLMRPVSEHGFLNLRTYVRCGSESGIYFMAEWLSNALPVPLGRPFFGLPYHFAKNEYHHCEDPIRGQVTEGSKQFRYHAAPQDDEPPAPCLEGSLDEFLLERYTAFTHWHDFNRMFRVWHNPWAVKPLDLAVDELTLLDKAGPWIHEARFAGAHWSPGADDVWMGHPQRLPKSI
jgi:hypothetical protein